MSNPTEKFAAELAATIRKVDEETKDRRFDWAVVRLSELKPGTVEEQTAQARTMLKPKRADAPVEFGIELAAVWMLEGEPTSAPEFPPPMGSFKPEWAFIDKSVLQRRMPLGGREPNDSDYMRLALENYGKKGDDVTTPVKILDDRVAVWLHDTVPTHQPT